MSDQPCSVGDGLSRAMARADELRQTSPRCVRVRIVTRHGDLDPGVIIVANIAAKTNPELEAQMGKGVRYVPLAELDARAHELPGLVDEAAAEVEAAVAGAPLPPKRPSQREVDFDHAAYEAVITDSYAAMLGSTSPFTARTTTSLSSASVKEALASAALKVAALAAIGARLEFADLVDMLRFEYNDARERANISAGPEARVH